MKKLVSIIFVLCMVSVHVRAQKQTDQSLSNTNARITGAVPKGLDGDTITLRVWEHDINGMGFSRFFQPQVMSTVVENGKFEFVMEVTQPVQYFSLSSQQKHGVWTEQFGFFDGMMKDQSRIAERPIINLEHYIVEPGDDIQMNLYGSNISFQGKGAEKLSTISEMLYTAGAPRIFSMMAGDFEGIKKRIPRLHEIGQFRLQVIERHREQMSSAAYQILRADVIGWVGRMLAGSIKSTSPDTTIRREFAALFEEELKGRPVALLAETDNDILALSAEYAEFIIRRNDTEHWYNQTVELLGQPSAATGEIRKPYDIMVEDFSGALRDKLLFMYTAYQLQLSTQDKVEQLVHSSLAVVETSPYRDHLEGFRDNFVSQAPVYDFTLEDAEGNTVRLSDFKGKMVYIDMWFTGCGACMFAAEGTREVEKHFKERDDIVFLSISIDKERDKWLSSIRKEIPTESTHKFAGKYYAGDQSIYLYTQGRGSSDPFVQKYVTRGYPTHMLVDKEGRLHTARPPRPWREGNNDKNQEVVDFLLNALDSEE